MNKSIFNELTFLFGDSAEACLIKKDKKIFIFGLTNDALLLRRALSSISVRIHGYLENDSKKIGKFFDGVECFDPINFDWKKIDALVLLCAITKHESQKQQLEKLGLPSDQILLDEAYRNKVKQNESLIKFARKIGLNCLLNDENKEHADLIKEGEATFIGDVNGKVFDKHSYRDWRKIRLRKLFSILREKNITVQNKSVVEFGSAHGQISQHFLARGARVTACEGNPINFEILRERFSRSTNIKTALLDNDTDWSRKFEGDGHFLCVHWGLLYHLYNWERDLRLACRFFQMISLESEVLDNGDPHAKAERLETGLDQSLNGRARVPTVQGIERIFKEENMTFRRFDDPDLNAEMDWGLFKYDWSSFPDHDVSPNNPRFHKRRFWFAYSCN